MNNHILEYYQAISDGTIIAGDKVKKAYKMIIEGLQSKSFFYAPKKAKAAIEFIETFGHHHEGQLAPKRIKLELWQKALLSAIYGIVDEDGFRQWREVFIVVGRKNGKSLLSSCISEKELFFGEYGSRIFYCAPKLDQAAICYDALYQMIRKEPELEKLVKKRRTDIYLEQTNSSAKPIAFNAKKSDGLNPQLVICDEISSWQGEAGLKQYEVLKSALGSRRQPLLISISTAGYVNESIYDELMKRSTSVLNGTSKEKRLLPLIYDIDDIEKWNDITELQKSNPNLNVSVKVDYLLEEIAIAEGSLSKKAEFLTKYCNKKQNISTAWLEASDIMKNFGEDITTQDLANTYAVAGIDLSRTTDLTSACIIVEKNGKLNVLSHFWLPSARIEEATKRDGVPYRIYIERGLLSCSGENVIDYNDCFEWLREIQEKYKIYLLQIGYDRYNAQYLTAQMEAYGWHCESVYQGENLTGIINETEGQIKSGAFNFGNNDLLKLHLFDSSLKINAVNGRRRLIKASSTAHIDGTAALLDAMCVRQNHLAELGDYLRNEG